MKKYFVIIAISILYLSSSCLAIDRGTIRNLARILLKDTTSTVNNPTFSDETYNDFINVVQEDIACYTRCCYGQYTVDTTSATAEYAKPTGIIAIDRVSYLGFTSTNTATPYKKLTKVTINELDRDRNSWENYNVGTPLYYTEYSTSIIVVPRMSATFVKTNGLKFDYYKYPDDLTSDTDIPFNGDTSLYAYHKLIVLGVVIWLKQAIGIDRIQDIQEYMALRESMRTEIKYKPDKSQGGIRVE